MNRQERVMSILARANPEPDENVEIDADWTAYLATIEERGNSSITASTGGTGPTVGTRKMRRILPAAAVAIAIVLAGLAIGTERDQVASSQDLAAADAFLRAHVEGDAESALALLADDAVLGTEPASGRSEYAALLDWYEATGYEWSVGQCARATTATNDIICPMQWGNGWSRALDSGPYPGEFRFDVDEGRITGFFISTGVAREYAEVGAAVDAFRVQHFGDQRETMFVDGRNTPRLTPESIALWGQLTSEFVEDNGGP